MARQLAIDTRQQLTAETDGGLPSWLTDADDTDPVKVEVNRVAKIATFTASPCRLAHHHSESEGGR